MGGKHFTDEATPPAPNSILLKVLTSTHSFTMFTTPLQKDSLPDLHGICQLRTRFFNQLVQLWQCNIWALHEGETGRLEIMAKELQTVIHGSFQTRNTESGFSRRPTTPRTTSHLWTVLERMNRIYRTRLSFLQHSGNTQHHGCSEPVFFIS